MKNCILILTLFLVTIAFSSCSANITNLSSSQLVSSVSISTSSNFPSQSEISTSVISQIGDTSESSNQRMFQSSSKGDTQSSSTLSTYISGSVTLDSNLVKLKYRYIYYQVPASYLDLLSEVDYRKYTEEQNDDDNPVLSQPAKTMKLKSFVQRFHITREQFGKASELLMQDYLSNNLDMHHEMNEIPNADIIYTFDDNIINEYYRRA